jgi:hypothetical protein
MKVISIKPDVGRKRGLVRPEKKVIWNLPNSLTIARIMAIPIIVLLLFYPGKIASFVAAIIFLFAAITAAPEYRHYPREIPRSPGG